MIGGPRRQRRRRGRLLLLAVLGLLAGAALFVLGVGLGRALEREPDAGPPRTLVRTLEPLTVAPETATVTVTVTGK